MAHLQGGEKKLILKSWVCLVLNVLIGEKGWLNRYGYKVEKFAGDQRSQFEIGDEGVKL